MVLFLPRFIFLVVVLRAVEGQSILDVLESSGGTFSTLLEVFTRSNMTNLLHRTDSLTLFAPNDEAFSKLSPISVYTTHELKNILSYHVLDRAVKSNDLFNVSQYNTLLAGKDISLEFVDGILRINRNANVTKTDVEAFNGFIHVIDSLLIPNYTRTIELEAVDSEDKLSTIHPVFSSMMKITNEKFGLFDELETGIGYTLLAPNLLARFAPLDKLTNGKILIDTRIIHELMKHYALRFNVLSSNIGSERYIETISEKYAIFDRDSRGDFTVNGFNVSFSDERNFNKIVHYIDGFFIPDSFVNPKGLMDVMREYILYGAGSLFEGSSLSKLINEGGPYTVLAPINDFLSGGINPAMRAEIKSNQSVKENLVKYHIIPGVLMSYDLKNEQTVTTINGQNISLSSRDGGLTVNGINVVQTDIYANNGIMHLIEDILVPRSEIHQQTNLVDTLKAYQFDILASMIEAAGLTELLAGESYIIFAPTDSAFDASFSPEEINSLLVSNTTLLTEILKYHMTSFVNGFNFTQDHTFGTLLGEIQKLRTNSYRRQYDFGEVTSFPTIDGKPIRRTIQASNGVIHVIDAVLTPSIGNVSDVLADEINLSTFNSAIKIVGLDTLLSSDGNFTVFAPTNAAFKKLPAEKLANFLKDETKLSLLLKSHILPTVVYKAGHRINIEQTIGLGNLFMNKEFDDGGTPASVTNYRVTANIEQFDLKAINGVVHKIDTVLDKGFFTDIEK